MSKVTLPKPAEIVQIIHDSFTDESVAFVDNVVVVSEACKKENYCNEILSKNCLPIIVDCLTFNEVESIICVLGILINLTKTKKSAVPYDKTAIIDHLIAIFDAQESPDEYPEGDYAETYSFAKKLITFLLKQKCYKGTLPREEEFLNSLSRLFTDNITKINLDVFHGLKDTKKWDKIPIDPTTKKLYEKAKDKDYQYGPEEPFAPNQPIFTNHFLNEKLPSLRILLAEKDNPQPPAENQLDGLSIAGPSQVENDPSEPENEPSDPEEDKEPKPAPKKASKETKEKDKPRKGKDKSPSEEPEPVQEKKKDTSKQKEKTEPSSKTDKKTKGTSKHKVEEEETPAKQDKKKEKSKHKPKPPPPPPESESSEDSASDDDEETSSDEDLEPKDEIDETLLVLQRTATTIHQLAKFQMVGGMKPSERDEMRFSERMLQPNDDLPRSKKSKSRNNQSFVLTSNSVRSMTRQQKQLLGTLVGANPEAAIKKKEGKDPSESVYLRFLPLSLSILSSACIIKQHLRESYAASPLSSSQRGMVDEYHARQELLEKDKEIAELRSQLSSVLQDGGVVDDTYFLKSQRDKLQRELEQSHQRLANVEQTERRLNEQKDKLEAEKRSLEMDNDRLRDNVSQLTSRIREAESNLRDEERKREEAERSRRKAKSEADRMKEKVEDLRESHRQLRKEQAKEESRRATSNLSRSNRSLNRSRRYSPSSQSESDSLHSFTSHDDHSDSFAGRGRSKSRRRDTGRASGHSRSVNRGRSRDQSQSDSDTFSHNSDSNSHESSNRQHYRMKSQSRSRHNSRSPQKKSRGSSSPEYSTRKSGNGYHDRSLHSSQHGSSQKRRRYD
ncbi:hypothetical protein BLNAU_12951 [Blattamonas nauphoetae]|uniref:Uncharacterized protein n=1 Tax=Blattamonas nauphoetae TaxID=2049346 RepID=A0ABQ9XKU7_9EUKA|nr:hypothetical protein BLNAU_12951 [Blattamonas nauphoetae]